MEFHHFTATFPWSFRQIIAGGDLPVQCLVRTVLNPCKVVKFVSFPMKVVHSPTLLNQNRKSVNTKKDLAKMWPGKLNVDMFFFCSKMFATSQLLQKSWKFWKLTFLFKKNPKKTFRFHSRFGRSVQNIVLFFFGPSPSSQNPNPSAQPLLQWPQRSRHKSSPLWEWLQQIGKGGNVKSTQKPQKRGNYLILFVFIWF